MRESVDSYDLIMSHGNNIYYSYEYNSNENGSRILAPILICNKKELEDVQESILFRRS